MAISALTAAQQAACNGACPALQGMGMGDLLAALITAANEGSLVSGSVDTAQLAASAVTAAKLATDAVETAKVKNGAVTAAKLATDAVETAKVKDAAVTPAKLGGLAALFAAGLSAGLTIAAGDEAVTGTADVVTGLDTITFAVAVLKDAPSTGGLWVQAVAAATAGTLTLNVFKPTAAGDCTPIAATAEKNVTWLALGTKAAA